MTQTVPLTPGKRLRSQVCDTEVIVIRPGEAPISLLCGGAAMIPTDRVPDDQLKRDPTLSNGSPLGKRFTDPSDNDLELLVVRSGQGTLSNGAVPLIERAPRQLPASD